MATINGMWLLNSEVDLSVELMEEVQFENTVFGSLCLKCCAMSISSSGIVYHVTEHIPPMSFGGNAHTAYDSEKRWYRVGHDIVNFGNSQTVSDEFANWISNNGERLVDVSGCWRWYNNPGLLSQSISEKVSFEAGALNGRACRDIFITSEGISYRTKEGENYAIYNGDWRMSEANASHELINFGSKKYVTITFYNYLNTHARQVSGDAWQSAFSLISGIRYWNDVLELPENPIIFHISAKSYLANGYPQKYEIQITETGITAFWQDSQAVIYSKTEGWLPVYGTTYQLLDYGVTDQYITKTAKQFIESQSVDITNAETLVKYNGKIIAPMSKQESNILLKCMDKKMASGVEVFTLPSATEQHLTFSDKKQTIEKGFRFATKEIWFSDVEWDFCIGEAWGGYPLGFKKLDGFIVPEDMARLGIPEVSLMIKTVDPNRGEDETYFYDGEALRESFITMEGGMTYQFGIFTMVKDAEEFNSYYGTNKFEDNSVYISNWHYMQVGGERYGGIISDELGYVITFPIAEDKTCSFVNVTNMDQYKDEIDLQFSKNGNYEINRYVSEVYVKMPTVCVVDNEEYLNNEEESSFAFVLGGED